MKDLAILSIYVSTETRKKLKKMAIDQEKTMGEILEEIIIMRWQELTAKNKNGTIQSICPTTAID